MREISTIHNSAPRTLRRGDGICRMCSDNVVSSTRATPADTVPAEIRSPKRGANFSPGAKGSIGVGGGIRGHCLDLTKQRPMLGGALEDAPRLRL